MKTLCFAPFLPPAAAVKESGSFFSYFFRKVLAAGELCAIIKQHAEQFVLLHKMNWFNRLFSKSSLGSAFGLGKSGHCIHLLLEM